MTDDETHDDELDPVYEPPAHLSPAAQSLWRAVVPDRARSIGRLILLETALESYDRALEAAEAVDQDGLSFKTESTGAIHIHPALKAEKEFRAQFMRTWQELGFDFESALDGRRGR